jgi:hypothetical protein
MWLMMIDKSFFVVQFIQFFANIFPSEKASSGNFI